MAAPCSDLICVGPGCAPRMVQDPISGSTFPVPNGTDFQGIFQAGQNFANNGGTVFRSDMRRSRMRTTDGSGSNIGKYISCSQRHGLPGYISSWTKLCE